MQVMPTSIRRATIPLIGSAILSVVVAFGALGSNAFGLLFFAAIWLLAQWYFAPNLIRWLVKPRLIFHDGLRYLVPPGCPDARVARMLADRCHLAGLPLVEFGIITDPQPNAFTFGRTRKSATIVVSQTLIDALDDHQLDTILCHELAHIEHRDVVVMTAAASVPLLLTTVGRVLIDADGDDDEGSGLALIGFVLIAMSFVADLLILALARSREYAADRRSCEVTGKGDALATALICVGRSVVDGRNQRLVAASALGFTDPRITRATQLTAMADRDLVDELRKELTSRKAGFRELFSSHPSVARRIAALERSGLPGAPQRFGLTTNH